MLSRMVSVAGGEWDRGSTSRAVAEAGDRLKSIFSAGQQQQQATQRQSQSAIEALTAALSNNSTSSSSSAAPSPSEQSQVQAIWLQLTGSGPALVATTLGGTTLTYAIYRRYFRRIATTAYLTPSTLRWRRMIVGKCLSVGDADGFRLYHMPGPPLYRNLVYGNVERATGANGHSHGHGANAGGHHGSGAAVSIQQDTISVRLAGADAPESGHFGKPSQPFAKEAKEELQKLVLGREVWCQIAHIDQYQRLVATPYVWLSPYIFGRTNVSLHLVKHGLATVYTQAGAAYGSAGPAIRFLRWLLGVDKPGTDTSARTRILDWIIPLSGEARLRRAQARAKRRKKGVWSLKKFETPEDYKKRMRAGS